jgi:uracil-DNA glycosylase
MADKGAAALPIILDRLHKAYPNATYELNWSTPLELLVGTILAAQCTDERVNRVTQSLFRKYPNAQAYARAPLAELEEDVKPTGFYKKKAQTIQEMCRALLDHFQGEVPSTMDEMLTLPGVARKTANVVLNCAFKIPSGVIVDTHVERTSQRLGLSTQKKPEQIEQDLMALVPKDEWVFFGPALVLHGRYTCTSSNPKCPDCVLNDVCEKNGVNGAPTMSTTPKKIGTTAGSKAAPARSSPLTTKSFVSKGKPSGVGMKIPSSWQAAIGSELSKPYFKQLEEFLAQERANHKVFPPEDKVFSALQYTPYDQVNVLLLGQDPYHDDGQAHGLCFSVQPGIKPPPSLLNMFQELQNDIGCRIPNHGYLVHWARQGMLLLNAVLTVRAHTPNSHKNKGWEKFTDAIISRVNEKDSPVVFVLWGAYAQKKIKLIDTSRHTVIQSAHPSPLSANNGFFGSRPYSKINAALRAAGKPEIDWEIPDLDKINEDIPF